MCLFLLALHPLSSLPNSLPPTQKFCDVQQRADGRCSLHGGSAGEDSAPAGTQSKTFSHAGEITSSDEQINTFPIKQAEPLARRRREEEPLSVPLSLPHCAHLRGAPPLFVQMRLKEAEERRGLGAEE